MPLKTCPSCQKQVGPRLRKCECGHEFATSGSSAAARPTAAPAEEGLGRSAGHSPMVVRVYAPGVGGDGKNVVYPVKLEDVEPSTVRRWLIDTQRYMQERGKWYTLEAFRYILFHYARQHLFDLKGHVHGDPLPGYKELAATVKEQYEAMWGVDQDTIENLFKAREQRERLGTMAHGTPRGTRRKAETVLNELREQEKPVNVEVDENEFFKDFGIGQTEDEPEDDEEPALLPPQ